MLGKDLEDPHKQTGSWGGGVGLSLEFVESWDGIGMGIGMGTGMGIGNGDGDGMGGKRL